jgi:hypothetical protein
MPRRRKVQIKSADELIEEATGRLASLDRRLANLKRLRPQSASVQELREQRDRARMELLELVELAEMPPEFMGWA